MYAKSPLALSVDCSAQELFSSLHHSVLVLLFFNDFCSDTFIDLGNLLAIWSMLCAGCFENMETILRPKAFFSVTVLGLTDLYIS